MSFLFVQESYQGYQLIFICHVFLGSSSWWLFVRLSLILMTLVGLRSTGKIICRIPPLRFVWCFSHDSTGIWVFGRKTTEVICHSHHIISKICACNMTSSLLVTLNTGPRQCYQFLHGKVTLNFSILHSLEGSHYVQPHRKKINLYFLERQVSAYIIWNSSAWRFAYCLLFICLFIIQLFIYINMN